MAAACAREGRFCSPAGVAGAQHRGWFIKRLPSKFLPREMGTSSPKTKTKGSGRVCHLFTVFYTSAVFRISSRAGGWVTGHSPTTPAHLHSASLAQIAINKWITHALQRVCSSPTSA